MRCHFCNNPIHLKEFTDGLTWMHDFTEVMTCSLHHKTITGEWDDSYLDKVATPPVSDALVDLDQIIRDLSAL